MGAVEGAIIGAVIGLGISVVMLVKRASRRKKLVAALANEGSEKASSLLDAALPPTESIALSKIIEQRERMAGLAVVGDVDALRSEIAAHGGPLTAHAQVDAIAFLALAVLGEVEEAVDGLGRLADRIEDEGGRGLVLVKRKVRALSALAQGIAGQSLQPSQRLRIDSVASEGGLVQLLVWQGLSLAMRALGNEAQAEGLANKVRRVTRAFERDARGVAAGGEGSIRNHV